LGRGMWTSMSPRSHTPISLRSAWKMAEKDSTESEARRIAAGAWAGPPRKETVRSKGTPRMTTSAFSKGQSAERKKSGRTLIWRLP